MRKEPLMRLDVHDEGGAALVVWGTEDNGRLARDIVESGFAGLKEAAVNQQELELMERIVLSPDVTRARRDIDSLFQLLPKAESAGAQDSHSVLRALVESLADNFIFIVELPTEAIGRRTLVKMNYDGALGGRASPGLTARYATTVDGTDWSGAVSWHLEVQAPEGLVVEGLKHRILDPDALLPPTSGKSARTGPTAHIAGSRVPSDTQAEARLILRPDPTGLVNQTVLAAAFTWLLLTVMCLNGRALAPLVADGDRAGALAGVTLAVPAVLVAWMARGQEHELASRLLVVPRLLNALTATVLLAAAAALVLGLDASQLEETMLLLFVIQWWLLVWATYVRVPVSPST